MNKISPKVLLYSKWTKVSVSNREKHFTVTSVSFDEQQRVTECIIEAVISGNEYEIEWWELKDSEVWRLGWK